MGRSVTLFLERVTVREEGNTEVGCTVTQAEERG